MLVVGRGGFRAGVPATPEPTREEQQAEARGGTERAAGAGRSAIVTEEEFCRLAGVPTPES